MSDLMAVRWRQGRKLGRTIYADDPDVTGDGVLLGMMETVGIAGYVVGLHNVLLRAEFAFEYGHMVTPEGQPDAAPVWVNEPRGLNYATHRRGVYREGVETIGPLE